MSQERGPVGRSLGVLKKIVVGWALLAGMVVYSLLAGMNQLFRWSGERARRVRASVGPSASRSSPPERLPPSERRYD